MAMVNLGQLKTSETLKLAFWFILAILIGAILRWQYQSSWPLYGPVIAISDGLIVAGFIGILLELFATKFLIQETAEHLANRMVGGDLPPKIKARIWEIATTNLVRKNYKKEYKLTDLGDGNLKVEATITFHVENFGPKTEKYLPAADAEKVFQPKFKYLQYSLKDVAYSFLEDALLKTLTDKHGNGTTVQVSGKEIRIAPRAEHQSAICDVRWVIQETMKDEWFDLTEFRLPTENATIFLSEKPDRLEFFCTGKTNDSRTWIFDEPFMVGQQLKVWWVKKYSLTGSPID